MTSDVEVFLGSIPAEVLELGDGGDVVEVGFGAGPAFAGSKIKPIPSGISLEQGVEWVVGYRSIYKRAHVRLRNGVVIYFHREGYEMHWRPGE